MALSKIAVRRPIAATMFFVGVVVLGLISLSRLSVDLFPDLKYPKLLVRTLYPNGTPEQVERFITEPVEEALGSVSGLKNVESHSSEGVSLSFLEFYWGTDMDYAALNIREKLDEVYQNLPEGAERSRVIKTDPSAKPIMTIALSGIELGRLTLVARDLIRRRLEELEGVAMVEVFGGIDRQILVKIDPEKLNSIDLSLNEIVQLISMNNSSRGGGTIRKGRYRYSIYIDGDIRGLDDIKNLALSRYRGNHVVFLKDIANIDYVPEDRVSITKLNGQPTIGLHVTKEAGTNTVFITEEAERVLKNLEKEIPGLKTFVVSKQADFINDSIHSVFSNLLWGGILAFLSLFLFLRKLRDPLNIGVSIPISVIATFALMYLTKVNINMMSLGGLALGVGMLVDNSIVVLENIFRLKEEGMSLVESAVQGAKEVSMPVFASTLTSCAVFLPIIYVEGVAGQLFRDYSLTIAFSLLASVFVSLSILPVLVSKYQGRMLKNSDEFLLFHDFQENKKKNGFFRFLIFQAFSLFGWFQKKIQGFYGFITKPLFAMADQMISFVFCKYHSFVKYALDHKKKVIMGFFVIAALTFFTGMLIDIRLLPPVKQNEILYSITLPEDAALYQTEMVSAEIEKILQSEPEVDFFFTRVGPLQSIFSAAEFEDENTAAVTIRLKEGTDALSFISELKNKLPGHFLYQGNFSAGDLRFNDVLGISGKDVEVYVQGPSFPFVYNAALSFQNNMSKIQGLKDVILDYQEGISEYRVSVNKDKALRYGLNVNNVIDALSGLTGGVVASKVKEMNRAVQILVRADDEFRSDWDRIYKHQIKTRYGYVPLSELIDYEIVKAPEKMTRVKQMSTLKIFARIENRPRKEVIEDIRDLMEKSPERELIKYRLGGQQDEMEKSFDSLKIAFLLSLILIYLILAAQFESLKYPFIVLFSVPYGLIGAVAFLAISNGSLNIMSGIGIIVLTGIVINDDIVKIDFINQERKKGTPLRQAVLIAGEKRFRPIVITTLTTVFGLLPMMFASGNGSELQKSLAVVIIGGMISGTILTLIMVPVFYELFSVNLKFFKKNEESL